MTRPSDEIAQRAALMKIYRWKKLQKIYLPSLPFAKFLYCVVRLSRTVFGHQQRPANFLYHQYRGQRRRVKVIDSTRSQALLSRWPEHRRKLN